MQVVARAEMADIFGHQAVGQSHQGKILGYHKARDMTTLARQVS